MIVSLDGDDAHDGKQSLRVEVLSTRPSSRVFYQVWSKPSFSTRTAVEPGKQYRISCWYKNKGSRLHMRWVTTSDDYQVHHRHRDVMDTAEIADQWHQVEELICTEHCTEHNEHLLELIIVATDPGVFWFDDVAITEFGQCTAANSVADVWTTHHRTL